VRLNNVITHDRREIPAEQASFWVESCTPWATYDGGRIMAPSTCWVGRSVFDLKQIDPKKVSQFWNSCLSCVRSVVTARKLDELSRKQPDPAEANKTLINNSYAIAVLEWTKSFGTNSEDYHWKKVFGDSSFFLSEILEQTKATENEYKEYRQAMLDVRAFAIAHAGLPGCPPPKLPDFDFAISMISSAHSILDKLLISLDQYHGKVSKLNPMSMQSWIENLEEDIKLILGKTSTE